MAKLGILIAHYKEPLEKLKVMLNSINNQNVDFSQIKTYILNDGDEVVFKQEDFNEYMYEIKYQITSRSGVSKMRNKLIEIAQEEYIWFLDCDDYLIDNTLNIVLDKLNSNVDLVLVGTQIENKKHKTREYYPDYFNFGIMGCSIMRRQFLIDNNIYSDENAFLAGDIALENIPKFYTNKKLRITVPVHFYRYEPKSVVRDCENNGYKSEIYNVVCNMIKRLLSDNKIREAYFMYLNFIYTRYSKKVHDMFVDKFKELGLYNIDYKLDLR